MKIFQLLALVTLPLIKAAEFTSEDGENIQIDESLGDGSNESTKLVDTSSTSLTYLVEETDINSSNNDSDPKVLLPPNNSNNEDENLDADIENQDNDSESDDDNEEEELEQSNNLNDNTNNSNNEDATELNAVLNSSNTDIENQANDFKTDDDDNQTEELEQSNNLNDNAINSNQVPEFITTSQNTTDVQPNITSESSDTASLTTINANLNENPSNQVVINSSQSAVVTGNEALNNQSNQEVVELAGHTSTTTTAQSKKKATNIDSMSFINDGPFKELMKLTAKSNKKAYSSSSSSSSSSESDSNGKAKKCASNYNGNISMCPYFKKKTY